VEAGVRGGCEVDADAEGKEIEEGGHGGRLSGVTRCRGQDEMCLDGLTPFGLFLPARRSRHSHTPQMTSRQVEWR
jgi:hypothetical protein